MEMEISDGGKDSLQLCYLAKFSTSGKLQANGIMRLMSPTSSTRITEIIPASITAGVPVDITLNGRMDAGDKLGFASECSMMTTRDHEMEADCDSNTITLTIEEAPPLEMKLCYQRADGTDVVEQSDIVIARWKLLAVQRSHPSIE